MAEGYCYQFSDGCPSGWAGGRAGGGRRDFLYGPYLHNYTNYNLDISHIHSVCGVDVPFDTFVGV